MKALKGLLIYIGIVLGILAGIGAILICIMYFVPNFRPFGVGLVHYNKKTDTQVVELAEYTDYENIMINVNSNKININVRPTEETNISYNMGVNIFGFSTEITEYQIIRNVDVVDGVLQIYLTVTEPSGWISTSSSEVNVFVPTTTEFGLVTTTTKGKVSIGDDSLEMKLNALSMTTDKGDVRLSGIGTKEGDVRNLTLKTLSLKTKQGFFDLTNINNITVENKVDLVASDGEFRFKNLFASVDATGQGITIKADKIETGNDGFKLIAENSFLNISNLVSQSVVENTIVADNASIEIENITGRTAIVTVNGSVNLGVLNSYTIIENYNGDVDVSTAKDSIMITTHLGDIDVGEYYASGKFASNKGDISVKSVGDYAQGYETYITNVDGDIDLVNKINKVYIKTTGRSEIDVKFELVKTNFETVEEVFQHQVLASRDGECTVYVPAVDPCFKFKATGIISGDYSASDKDQYSTSDDNIDMVQISKTASFLFDGRINIQKYIPKGN